MKIKFKDMLLNAVFAPPSLCFVAPDDDGGDGGGSDDGGGGGNDDGGNDGDGGEAAAGLMANATGEEGGEDDGEKDSGKTVDFITDDGTEKLNVPDKFWDKEGDTLNQGAVLKSALEGGKAVRKLQNELAEAKKTGPAAVDKDVPKEAAGYLSDTEGDNPFIKDGHLQLGEDAKNLKPVPIDDPVIQMFAEVAKDEGLSVERAHRIMSKVLAGVDDAAPEALDVAAEAEKFGPNAGVVAGTNKTWADNLLKNGEISQAEHVHLLNMGQTAVGLSVVNKIRIQGGGKVIPLRAASGVSGELPSKAEWRAAMPNHRTDPSAYKKWQDQGAEIFGTGAAGSSENSTPVANSGGSQANYRDKDAGRRTSRNRR